VGYPDILIDCAFGQGCLETSNRHHIAYKHPPGWHDRGKQSPIMPMGETVAGGARGHVVGGARGQQMPISNIMPTLQTNETVGSDGCRAQAVDLRGNPNQKYVWECHTDKGWEAYDVATQRHIEQAYLSGLASVKLIGSLASHLIDFSTMLQRRPGAARQVQRRVLL